MAQGFELVVVGLCILIGGVWGFFIISKGSLSYGVLGVVLGAILGIIICAIVGAHKHGNGRKSSNGENGRTVRG